VGYTPHRKQWLYHNALQRFKAPVCGRRFGKSTMAGMDVSPELFIPDRWYWIVGPNYDLAEKEFRVVWECLRKLGVLKSKEVKSAYNKKGGDMYIKLPWRTMLEVKSAQHRETLVGEGLDGAIMSEAAKHHPDTWNRFVRPSLGDKMGWASFPTTPEGQNWLYSDVWQYGLKGRIKDYVSWRFPSWENEAIYGPEGPFTGYNHPEIQLLLQTLSQAEFDQEIAALFTAFVGRIFDEFDETIHVSDVEYDPNLPNYAMFDFGFVNPLACIEVQITPQDEVRVWREHYKSHWLLQQHLDYITGKDPGDSSLEPRVDPPGYRGIDMAFGDAADPEAVETINQYGIPCIAEPEAKSNWRQGIDLHKSFLRAHPIPGAEDAWGAPVYRTHLQVDRKCRNTIREYNNYKAKQGTTTGRNPQTAKEEGQKIDDHAMDAIRYGLMHIYELGCTSHLSDVMSSYPKAQNLLKVDTSDPSLILLQEGGWGSDHTFVSMDMEF